MNRSALILALCACVSCTHRVESASHSPVATVMARQVQNAADAGDGDLELRVLRQRLARNSADLDARILLARVYLRRGFPDLALEHERLTVAQFPDSAVAVLALAKTLRQMDQPAEALDASDAFVARHPRAGWELLSIQGILQDELGHFARGEQAHRAALQIDPQQSALHNNLGYNLLLQGQVQAAAVEFREAIQLDPRSQFAHNNLAAALVAAQAPAEALQEWQRAAGPAVAHNNLAAVLMEQGRYAEARRELETALKFRSDFAPALVNLELVSQHDGRPSTIPRPGGVNFLKRFASTLGRISGAQESR